MKRRWALQLVLLAGFAGACVDAADSDTNPVGFEPIDTSDGSCELLEERALQLNEEAPIGISGDDILLRAEGFHLSTLHYPDETSLPIEVTVTYSAGAVTFFDREVEGSPDAETVAACIDTVEVAVIMDISSEDGIFDETGLPVHIVGIIENESSWSTTLNLEDLGGTYEVTEVDPTAFTDIEIAIEGTFVTQGSGGVIEGLGWADGRRTTGAEPVSFAIAEWVPPGQEG